MNICLCGSFVIYAGCSANIPAQFYIGIHLGMTRPRDIKVNIVSYQVKTFYICTTRSLYLKFLCIPLEFYTTGTRNICCNFWSAYLHGYIAASAEININIRSTIDLSFTENVTST